MLLRQPTSVGPSHISQTVVFLSMALVFSCSVPFSPVAVAEDTASLAYAESIDSIYQARNRQPIWISPEGRLNSSALTLVSLLRDADQDGLRPTDYHVAELSHLLGNADTRIPICTEPVGNLIEPLLTDAFLSFGLDLNLGRVDPGLVYSRWDDRRNLLGTLEALVGMLITAPVGESGSGFDPAAALDLIRPQHFDYRSLQIALAYYRMVARSGGWPVIPGGDTLHPGDRSHRVSLVRARLQGRCGAGPDFARRPLPVSPWNWFAGFFTPETAPAEPDFFDDELTTAVRSFQKRHGLRADGLVGKKTLAALNEPAHLKADRIALNLERIRWLPAEPDSPFVRVNIPACHLDLMDRGQAVLSMKTIVGRPDCPTPIMSDRIGWLEFNPYWNVPQKLVRRDILPKVLADPAYLSDRDFHVFENWKRGAEEIDVDEIDWTRLNSWDIAFRFRQDPGPRNPLGRIKFVFPNRFSIYLHDTNQKGGFHRDNRYDSAGCVRLEDPDSLARILVPETDLEALLESRENKIVGLGKRVPIFLVYQTVWIDNSGRINFAPDIYGYDARMKEILAGEGETTLVSN